ncbi:DUF2180 family protein [Solihabitans fulvus]
MNCLDCTGAGRPAPAVGVCVTCGAGVCASCAHVGSKIVRHAAGFTSAAVGETEIRTISCTPCYEALRVHHPHLCGGQGLVPAQQATG